MVNNCENFDSFGPEFSGSLVNIAAMIHSLGTEAWRRDGDGFGFRTVGGAIGAVADVVEETRRALCQASRRSCWFFRGFIC